MSITAGADGLKVCLGETSRTAIPDAKTDPSAGLDSVTFTWEASCNRVGAGNCAGALRGESFSAFGGCDGFPFHKLGA